MVNSFIFLTSFQILLRISNFCFHIIGFHYFLPPLAEIPSLSWCFPSKSYPNHLVCNFFSLSFQVSIHFFFFPFLIIYWFFFLLVKSISVDMVIISCCNRSFLVLFCFLFVLFFFLFFFFVAWTYLLMMMNPVPFFLDTESMSMPSLRCKILCIIIIFTKPSARTGYDTRWIFKRSLTGLNSEFSFS